MKVQIYTRPRETVKFQKVDFAEYLGLRENTKWRKIAVASAVGIAYGVLLLKAPHSNLLNLGCMPIFLPFTAHNELDQIWFFNKFSRRWQRIQFLLASFSGTLFVTNLATGNVVESLLMLVQWIYGIASGVPNGPQYLKPYMILTFCNSTFLAIRAFEYLKFFRGTVFSFNYSWVLNLSHGSLLLSPVVSLFALLVAYRLLKSTERRQIPETEIVVPVEMTEPPRERGIEIGRFQPFTTEAFSLDSS